MRKAGNVLHATFIASSPLPPLLPSHLFSPPTSTAANISLSSSEFHIEEREGLQQFSVVRSGSIDRVNKVLCKLKPIDATAQVMDETRADFVVPHRPETITFQPRNTTECE